jgi:prophage regulatory protein
MKLHRFPELNEVFGIGYSRTHIDRMEKAGKFPRRIKLSAKYVAWRSDDLEKFIDIEPSQVAGMLGSY